MPGNFKYTDVSNRKAAKHQYRFKTTRDDPEELWGEKIDGVLKFLLFYTEDIAGWAKSLCSILDKYQIRFSIYSNGTIMIHPQETKKLKEVKGKTEKEPLPLEEFSKEFDKMKASMLALMVGALELDDAQVGRTKVKGENTKQQDLTEPTECCFCLHPLTN